MKNTILIFAIIAFFTQINFAQHSVKDFYEADIKALKKQYEEEYDTPFDAVRTLRKDIIKVEDLNNGYMSYKLDDFGVTGYKEMAHYTSDNGKEFVATVSIACAPRCGLWDLNFLELENGQLVNKTDIYFPESLQKQVQEVLKPYQNRADVAVWMKLPHIKETLKKHTSPSGKSKTYKAWKEGYNIKIGYFHGATMEFYEPHFKLLAELLYDTKTGTFTFLKR